MQTLNFSRLPAPSRQRHWRSLGLTYQWCPCINCPHVGSCEYRKIVDQLSRAQVPCSTAVFYPFIGCTQSWVSQARIRSWSYRRGARPFSCRTRGTSEQIVCWWQTFFWTIKVSLYIQITCSCHSFHWLSTYMFAHYTMNAKMEASGSSTAYPLDPKMWRRPRYWEMRPVRFIFGTLAMPHIYLVGIVFR